MLFCFSADLRIFQIAEIVGSSLAPNARNRLIGIPVIPNIGTQPNQNFADQIAQTVGRYLDLDANGERIIDALVVG
ncbi:hypothetical protein C1J02_04950 [Sulfitobacter sp. SK011]|nr:hypothetical protein C1J02_04950 [Sulfitobacter sp. SK011]